MVENDDFWEWELEMKIQAQEAKRNAELKAQSDKDDALVAKIMVAMDAKYGHLLDRSDLNQIIKETKCQK